MTSDDRAIKRARVLTALDAAGLDAVWLTSPAALGWYLEGARVHTSLAGTPVAAVRVGRDGDLVRLFSNEAERLVAEELPAGVAVDPVEWHRPLVDDRADTVPEAMMDAALRAARAVLLPAERRRYAALGAETAVLLTDELATARPDETESALAARIAARVVTMGADPLVVMVAGDQRGGFRHPLPTGAVLGERAMVVVCARRHGLIANTTRWVEFGPSARQVRDRTEAIARVEAAAWRATRPGRPLRAVLGDIAAAYRSEGFDADEWRRHHQGGAAGYAGRDPRATPDTLDVVQDGQAFAWNPTAPGTKIEDTVVVDGGVVTVLTSDARWPHAPVNGVPRPLALRP